MFVKERADSRGSNAAFEGSTGKLSYDIQLDAGETETTAYDYLVANAPATFTTSTGTAYQFQSVSITPADVGGGILVGEVMYQQTKPIQFTFQTGGGSEKLDYGRESMHHYSAAGKDLGDVPDYNGGINVSKTSIEGVTIRTANFQFKITKSWAKGQPINAYGAFADRDDHDEEDEGYRYLSVDGDGSTVFTPILYVMGPGGSADWSEAAHVAGEIDGQYMRDVEEMTAKYNNAPVTLIIDGIWMHFLLGELFFDGTDGGKTTDNRVELTYSFSVSRNIIDSDLDTHRDIGHGAAVIHITEKRGWDLIWIYSEETNDANVLVRTPKAAYVERIYRLGDFDELRLNE